MAGLTPAPDTKAPDQYGVIGHPVGHSWSPFIHGMFAQQTGQNLSYRLFDVAPADFAQQIVELFAHNVRGLNVTIPHKQSAAAVAAQLTARARRAGAVNTLVRQGDGTLLGDNTDGAGLVNDLQRNLRFSLAAKRVLMLGAGGAARGVLAPLLEQSVRELTIANRNEARAQALCAEFRAAGNVSGCGFATLRSETYDLIINATAASLQGEMPPLPAGLVGEATICYDMVYSRSATPFTDWARAQHAGLACKGWGMLVEQAALSFQLWRGVQPDTGPVLQALAANG